MHTAHKAPAVALTARPAAEIDADLLVIPSFTDDDLAEEPELDRASGGEVTRARSRGEFTGKPYEVLSIALTGWKAPRAVLVGAGPRAEVTTDHLRRIATVGGLAARQRRLTRVAILFRPGTSVVPLLAAQVVAEGAVLANYDGASWKTADQPTNWLERVELRIAAAPEGVQEALDRGRILGEYTNHARGLANAPGNELTPRAFAERSVTRCTRS